MKIKYRERCCRNLSSYRNRSDFPYFIKKIKSKIKQSFELGQHAAYDKQTDMTLNNRIAQMGDVMTKTFGKH